MSPRVDVELDIFSGMPNPTWTLTNDEAESFVKQLSALPQTSAREVTGNLGYRGFIVSMTEGTDERVIRVQNGAVHVCKGKTTVYADDTGRKLERWLLDTGKAHLNDELFHLVEREFR
jgi:hypothetical protein